MGFALKFRHHPPEVEGEVSTLQLWIDPPFDGNGVIEGTPERADIAFLFVGSGKLKILHRDNGPAPRFVKQRLFMGSVVNDEAFCV